MKSLRRETQIFSYKFSVLNFAITASKYTRMHHFEAIFQKFPGGDPPDPHLWEGVTTSPTLPLSALRASVKPSASNLCAPAVFDCWRNRTQEKSYPREIVPKLNGYDFSGEIVPRVRFNQRYRTQGTISPEISYPDKEILIR